MWPSCEVSGDLELPLAMGSIALGQQLLGVGLFLSIKFYWHVATPTGSHIPASRCNGRAEELVRQRPQVLQAPNVPDVTATGGVPVGSAP